jgi:hypothetical protein
MNTTDIINTVFNANNKPLMTAFNQLEQRASSFQKKMANVEQFSRLNSKLKEAGMYLGKQGQIYSKNRQGALSQAEAMMRITEESKKQAKIASEKKEYLAAPGGMEELSKFSGYGRQLGMMANQGLNVNKQVDEMRKRLAKNKQQLDAFNNSLKESKNRFDMNTLSWMFGGMALQRVSLMMIRFMMPSMDKLEKLNTAGAKKVMGMSAAFEFLKISIFETLSNTPMFQKFVEWIIKGALWLSEFAQKHPTIVAIAATLAGIGTVLGTLAMGVGIFMQLEHLLTLLGIGGVAGEAEVAKEAIEKIKGKNIFITAYSKGLTAIKTMYDSLKSKSITIFTKGMGGLTALGQGAGGLFTGMFQGIGFALSTALSKISWTKIGSSLGNLFSKGFTSATGISTIVLAVGGIFSIWREKLNNFLDRLGFMGDILRIIGNLAGVAFNFVGGGIKIVLDILKRLFTEPLALLKEFTDWLGKWGEVFSYWGSLLKEKISNVLSKLFEMLPNWVQTAVTWIGNLLTNIGNFFVKIYNWFSEKFEPLFNWFSEKFGFIADLVKKGWQTVTGILDKTADSTEQLNKNTKEFDYSLEPVSEFKNELGFSNDSLNNLNSNLPDFQSSIKNTFGNQSSTGTAIGNAYAFGSELQADKLYFSELKEDINSWKPPDKHVNIYYHHHNKDGNGGSSGGIRSVGGGVYSNQEGTIVGSKDYVLEQIGSITV